MYFALRVASTMSGMPRRIHQTMLQHSKSRKEFLHPDESPRQGRQVKGGKDGDDRNNAEQFDHVHPRNLWVLFFWVLHRASLTTDVVSMTTFVVFSMQKSNYFSL